MTAALGQVTAALGQVTAAFGQVTAMLGGEGVCVRECGRLRLRIGCGSPSLYLRLLAFARALLHTLFTRARQHMRARASACLGQEVQGVGHARPHSQRPHQRRLLGPLLPARARVSVRA